MDRSSNTYGSVRKETRRRSRHTSGTSDFPRHVLSRPNEQEKPLKHQISFLLNQTHTGSSSLDQRHSDVQSRRHDPGSMSRSMHRPVKIEPAPEDMWRDAMRQSKNHRYGQSSYARRSSSEKRRTCEQCGKVFAQPADLKKQYVHLFICCFFFTVLTSQLHRFLTKIIIAFDLNQSIKCVHLKERPFQCDECEAAFGEKGNLK